MIWESESRNDILTMSVIVDTNSARHSFKSQVGNGFSSHEFADNKEFKRFQMYKNIHRCIEFALI